MYRLVYVLVILDAKPMVCTSSVHVFSALYQRGGPHFPIHVLLTQLLGWQHDESPILFPSLTCLLAVHVGTFY